MIVVAVVVAGAMLAQTPAAPSAACPNKSALKNVYFGDLHVHTSYSLDAYSVGDRFDPNDAYRFARGLSNDPKIDRPLDFVAVTDHSEFLSVVSLCTSDDATDRRARELPYCAALTKQGSLAQTVVTGLSLFGLGMAAPVPPALCQGNEKRGERCLKEERSVWKRIQKAAADNLDKCKFTTLVGFEWTAQDGKANLHRNVIFRSDVVPDEPFDFIRYPTAMSLWQELDQKCTKASGCDALTIPHNSNASAGKMWATVDDPAARPYLERYQRLTEIFQHKGASECLPGDALADPACSFEIVPGSFIAPTPGNDDVTHNGPGYVRDGLAKGLVVMRDTGTDPLALGIVGSTDTHNATPGRVQESTFQGHLGTVDATPEQRLRLRFFNPGGITGVWAEENTREAIFDALQRRETYATSGPRIVVRFLAVPGGVDDKAADALCADPEFPKALVDKGAVPMGSQLTTTAAPTLFAFAMQDQTPLGKLELVQLFADATGPHARVFTRDVVGGASTACMHWRADVPAKDTPALYYVRVREQPTWRWSHYDCAKDPEHCNGNDVKIEERAWTSPIFVSAPK